MSGLIGSPFKDQSSVATPDEIINALKFIIEMKQHDKDEFQSIGRDVSFNYFTEINKNTMKVFN